MTKTILILLLTAAAILCLSACGQTKTATSTLSSSTTPAVATSTSTQSSDGIRIDSVLKASLINGKTVATLYRPETEAETMQDYTTQFSKHLADFKIKSIIYVDSLTDGLLMLRSHKADVLETMSFTGRYLAQRNTDVTLYINTGWKSTTHMVFNPDKKAQLVKVNNALDAMQKDGVLNHLIGQWITNLPVGQEPSGEKLPVFEGADRLKLGISGDEPPLDYISADGTPGGFNVAVISEIAKRTNLNIEPVVVTSGARFSALQSGKIDAFLWYNATQDEEEMEEPYHLPMSNSYLDALGSSLVLK